MFGAVAWSPTAASNNELWHCGYSREKSSVGYMELSEKKKNGDPKECISAGWDMWRGCHRKQPMVQNIEGKEMVEEDLKTLGVRNCREEAR